MTKVTSAINKEHYTAHIHSDSNELIADEPLAAGGKDEGFSPSELLCASLAACSTITLRMYADRKGWPLEKAEVTVTMEKGATGNGTDIERRIALFGGLTEEQKLRFVEIAEQCPIHKILSNPINIKTSLL